VVVLKENKNEIEENQNQINGSAGLQPKDNGL